MADGLSEGKKETVESSLLSAAGGVAGKVISIPANLVVASVLGTTGFGILAVINVMIQYLGYLNLGMLANITREVPLAHGRGDLDEVRTIYGTISTNQALTTCIGLILLWVLFYSGFDFGGEILTSHLVIVTGVVLVSNTHSFFYSMVKGEGKFVTYGQYELFSGLTTPLGTLALVWFLGLNGMLLSLMWTHLLGLGFLLWRLEYPSFRMRFNWGKTKELLSTGLLMYVNKIIDGVFMSIAIILAGRYLSTGEVGVLGFALGFASIKKVPFARIFSVTINRKMALDGGEYGLDDRTRFARFFGTPYVIYLFILSLLIGAMVIFYAAAVNLFLPEFEDAIPILQILFFALVFYNARYFAYSYINVTRQMNTRTLILAIGAVINVVLGYAAIKAGYGVQGVAVSVAVAMLVISIHTIVFTFGQVFERRWAAVSFLVRLLLIAAALTAILSASIHYSWLGWESIASGLTKYLVAFIELAVEGGIFAVASLLLHIALFPEEGVFAEVKRLSRYVWDLMSRKTR